MTLDELDKLAATEVMGWYAGNCGPDVFYFDSPDNYDDIDEALYHVHKVYHQSGFDHWQPTRNIAQAWEMLDKFPEFRIDQEEGPKYLNVIIWDKGEMYYGTADTAPLAIVRACLKAKGVSVE
jgi:hypothetical protein